LVGPEEVPQEEKMEERWTEEYFRAQFPDATRVQLTHNAALFARKRVYAFFSMDGLGLAVLMEDGVGHHFLGASFSHRTSLCVCKRKTDGKLSSCNVNDDFLILGWGSTGGSREARLRREARAAAAV
jgi:hypothetical protein